MDYLDLTSSKCKSWQIKALKICFTTNCTQKEFKNIQEPCFFHKTLLLFTILLHSINIYTKTFQSITCGEPVQFCGVLFNRFCLVAFSWGYLKDIVCHDLKDAIHELDDNFTQAVRNIQENTLKNVYIIIKYYLFIVLRERGGHFENPRN